MKRTVIVTVCAVVLGISGYQLLTVDGRGVTEEEQIILGVERSKADSSEVLAVTTGHEINVVPDVIEPTVVEAPLSELERLLSKDVLPEKLSDKELAAKYDALTDFIEQSGLIERLNDEAVGDAELEQVNALFQLHDRLGMAQMKRQMSELTQEYSPEVLDDIQSDLDQLSLLVQEAEAQVAEIKQGRKEQEEFVQ